MQKTQIIGRIGNDAEVREANSGNTVINFNVAVSERWKNKEGEKQEKTTWYRCSWWIKNTTISQYLTKGTQVYVMGTAKAEAYTNKDNEIVVNEGINVRSLELLGGGGEPTPEKKTTKKDELDPKQHNDLPFDNDGLDF